MNVEKGSNFEDERENDFPSKSKGGRQIENSIMIIQSKMAYGPPALSLLVLAPFSFPLPPFFPHPWLCLRNSAFFSLFFSSTCHKHIDELNTKSNDSTRLDKKKRRTMYHPRSHILFIISKGKQRGKGQGPWYKRLNIGSHTSRLSSSTLTPFPSQAQESMLIFLLTFDMSWRLAP